MRGREGYWIAAGLLLVGIVAAVAFLWLGLRGLGDELPRVVVPGTAELDLRGGPHTIYHEAESVVDGRIFSTPDVSGLQVEVVSAESGEPVPLEAPAASSSYRLGGRSGSAVLTFRVAAPGRYRLTAGYPEGAGPQTVLAVGRGIGRRIFLAIGGALAVAFGSAGLALTLAVVTFVRRRRDRGASPPPGWRGPSPAAKLAP